MRIRDSKLFPFIIFYCFLPWPLIFLGVARASYPLIAAGLLCFVPVIAIGLIDRFQTGTVTLEVGSRPFNTKVYVFHRDKDPIAFWLLVSLQILLIPGILLFAVKAFTS